MWEKREEERAGIVLIRDETLPRTMEIDALLSVDVR